ncbi:MAG TPA: chemotaxis protein CheX [bacterium]|nr:chemotaxis protein CheX [bacterium]
MKNNYNEILEMTYTETLENLAFIFSDKLSEEEALELLDADQFYLSSMSFTGGLEGSMKLASEKEVGDIIAENMLGLMEEEDDSLFIDSLKEITNVICGKMITEIAGTEPIVDLTIPEVLKIDQSEWKELMKDEDSLVFNSEEYLVAVKFKLNNE